MVQAIPYQCELNCNYMIKGTAENKMYNIKYRAIVRLTQWNVMEFLYYLYSIIKTMDRYVVLDYIFDQTVKQLHMEESYSALFKAFAWYYLILNIMANKIVKAVIMKIGAAYISVESTKPLVFILT